MMRLDLSSLCASACEDLRLIRGENIALSRQLEEHVLVMRDRELLQRPLADLIANAYRYGKEYGYTQVSLRQEHVEILLSVTDDGGKIAKDQLVRMWQRFYQADTSRSDQGSGLELVAVQEIAQLRHGYMKVESVQGKGSYFTFYVSMK